MRTVAKEKARVNNKKFEVAINPELDKYQGKILFPKKLELAEQQLKGIDLSIIKNHRS